jgi:hypothetical protein
MCKGWLITRMMLKRRQTFLAGWLNHSDPVFELLRVVLTPSTLLFFDDAAEDNACRYRIALATVGDVVGLRVSADGGSALADSAADASAAMSGATCALEVTCHGSDTIESVILVAESEPERQRWIDAILSARQLRDEERKEFVIRRLDSDVRRGEGTHFIRLVQQLEAAETSGDVVWVLRQLGQYLRQFLESSASDKFGYMVAREEAPIPGAALWRPSVVARMRSGSANGGLLGEDGGAGSAGAASVGRGKQDAIMRSRRFWSPSSVRPKSECSLLTVTFCANHAHNLTRSP